MKFLVLAFAALAAARPDVSHLSGYQYKPPTTSYGVPIDTSYTSGHYHYEAPTSGYLPPTKHQQLPYLTNQGNFLDGQGSNGYDYNSQYIQDEKHVYYFAAPDVEEQTRLRIHIAPSNKKNTNVIFVKAPNYAPPIPEVIAPPPQVEDKTKVYVLIKKPEQPPAISIRAPTPVKSKPEIYLVKYENQHEAEKVISGGVGGEHIGSNIHHVQDGETFIKALHTDARINVPYHDKYSGFDGNIGFFGLRDNSGAGSQGQTQTGKVDSTQFQSLGVRSGAENSNQGGGSVVFVNQGSSESQAPKIGQEFSTPLLASVSGNTNGNSGATVEVTGNNQGGSAINAGSFEFTSTKSGSDFPVPSLTAFTSNGNAGASGGYEVLSVGKSDFGSNGGSGSSSFSVTNTGSQTDTFTSPVLIGSFGLRSGVEGTDVTSGSSVSGSVAQHATYGLPTAQVY